MTDLQVKMAEHLLNEQKLAVERQKLEEQRRSNMAQEGIKDRENIAKYGPGDYIAYDNSTGWMNMSDPYGPGQNRTGDGAWQMFQTIGKGLENVWDALPIGAIVKALA